MVVSRLLAILALAQAGASDQELLERARITAERFARGLSEVPHGIFYHTPRKPTRKHGSILVEYGLRLFYLNPGTLEVMSFGDMISLGYSPPVGVPRATDLQLFDLANEYWRFLGYTDPLGLYAMRDVDVHEGGGIVQLDLMRTYRGVPVHYDHGVMMHMTRYGGRLRGYYLMGPAAPPPATLTARLTPNQAAIVSERAIVSHSPQLDALYQIHPVRLQIWNPPNGMRARDGRRQLTPANQADLRAGKSLLVYWSYWTDLETLDKNGNVSYTYAVRSTQSRDTSSSLNRRALAAVAADSR